MVKRSVAGKVMLAVGAVGVAASITATLVGLRLLTELDRALDGSVRLTAQAVDALGASVELSEDTVVALQESLRQTESTTRDLVVAFDDAETILGATADRQDQVADSVEAIQRTLPTVVEVGAVIDRTLSALNTLPFGPDYRPDEPFDDSLRSLQQEMEGLPADLREQAALMREGMDSLGGVRQGTAAVADDVAVLRETLRSAQGVLSEYTATATEAGDLMGQADGSLGRQLAVARVLVVVLGATLLAGQMIPFGIGWLLLHPEGARAFLAEARPLNEARRGASDSVE